MAPSRLTANIFIPRWRVSPVRRAAQTVSLALFLYLFFHVCWPYAEVFTPTILSDKEWLPAELFLMLDPLVGLSTAIAARAVNPALTVGVLCLAVCLFVPRSFCGYICPLGTMIDLFDALLGALLFGPRWLYFRLTGRSPTKRKPVPRRWWMSLRYATLGGVLAASAGGVVLSGYVAAIPVATRAMALIVAPYQILWLKSEGQMRHVGWSEVLSIGLFGGIFLLGLFGRRFWCRYVCPSGALFSLAGLLRLTERKVDAACVGCGKCAEVCAFDAIHEDFATRGVDCTWCQTCGGVCPTQSINFTSRFPADEKPRTEPSPGPTVSRRDMLLGAMGGVGGAMGMQCVAVESGPLNALLRPPGSVGEAEFLDLCVRCGECFQVCPGPVLHPAPLEAGFDALWTPVVIPTHAGCHQDCNFCTQVCPTGAIRPLSLEEKRKTSIGLAAVDLGSCLAHQGTRDCSLCVDECTAAGYDAMEMRPIQLDLGPIPPGMFSDMELEAMARIDAPFVDTDACVGCGLCEYRCHTALVKQSKELEQAAIVVRP